MTQRRRPRLEREAEILAAARQVLEQSGLSGFSIPDVAASAGVSEATVFNYFPTRRDLTFRVVSDWMLPVIERLESDLPRIEGCRARIAFFAARHLIETAAAPGMHRLHWDGYYGSTLHRINQRYARLVTWIIEKAQSEGEVAAHVDAAIFRDCLFGTLHHIGWRTLLNGRPLDLERATEAIADQLVNGIILPRHIPGEGQPADAPLDAVLTRLEALADNLSQQGR